MAESKPPITDWATAVEEEEELQKKIQNVSIQPKEEEKKDEEDDDAPVKPKHENLLEDASSTVEVKRAAGASSSVESVSSWEEMGLKQELMDGVYAMNFQRPSKIQQAALPLLLKDPPENMIGQAHSGSGKTAAFSLTMLSRIDPTLDQTQAICLAPTKELAKQILDVVQKLAKFMPNVTSQLIIGGGERSSDRAKITSHILVATAGRLMDLLEKRRIDGRGVRVLVLDEADQMLERGAGDLGKRVKAKLNPRAQTLLFSATFNEVVSRYASEFSANANRITVKKEELTLKEIVQLKIACRDQDHKLETLSNIYGCMTVGQSIIFVNRKETARRVAEHMKAEGHMVTPMFGDLENEVRFKIMEEFRAGSTKVLVATNVLARGIDVRQVNLVINFDVPVNENGQIDPESYLHRIGRTGRYGDKGMAINLTDSHSERQLALIQDYFKADIQPLAPEDLESLEERVKALRA